MTRSARTLAAAAALFGALAAPAQAAAPTCLDVMVTGYVTSNPVNLAFIDEASDLNDLERRNPFICRDGRFHVCHGMFFAMGQAATAISEGPGVVGVKFEQAFTDGVRMIRVYARPESVKCLTIVGPRTRL